MSPKWVQRDQSAGFWFETRQLGEKDDAFKLLKTTKKKISISKVVFHKQGGKQTFSEPTEFRKFISIGLSLQEIPSYSLIETDNWNKEIL